jgi:hypothetical protein
LLGKEKSIQTFIKGYLKVIPKENLVYHFSSQDPNKITSFLEDLVYKTEQNKSLPIRNPLIFAFIEVKGKIMSNLIVLNEIKKILILAEKSNLKVVILSDQPRLPLSITKCLNTKIRFNLN